MVLSLVYLMFTCETVCEYREQGEGSRNTTLRSSCAERQDLDFQYKQYSVSFLLLFC